MLKRGWMNRYLPPIALETVPDLAIGFGYVWAGLMFFSAALNLVLALSLSVTQWGIGDVALGHRQQIRPVLHPVWRDENHRPPPPSRPGPPSPDRSARLLTERVQETQPPAHHADFCEAVVRGHPFPFRFSIFRPSSRAATRRWR